MNTDILPNLSQELNPIFDHLINFIESNYLISLIIVLLICIIFIIGSLLIKNEKLKTVLITAMSVIIVAFIGSNFIIFVNNYFN